MPKLNERVSKLEAIAADASLARAQKYLAGGLSAADLSEDEFGLALILLLQQAGAGPAKSDAMLQRVADEIEAERGK